MARYLLTHGLKDMDGVVFLDRHDAQMVLMRDGMRVMPLKQCGLPLSKRFTFYDQIHTTGMDIKQPVTSTAVITLGKDMTFRDYSQVRARELVVLGLREGGRGMGGLV